jgi:hypothetical protein
MALALVALASAVASPSVAQGSDRPPLVTLDIEASPELSRFANRLANWQPQRLEAFATLLGLATTGGEPAMAVKVILAPESGALARAAPSWVAGYARGDVSAVVLFPSRVPAYPDRSLEELLGHEVAHLMIYRAAAGRPLPRWFHEGLSMLAEQAWGLEDRGRLALAVLVRGRSDLAALDRLFANPEQVHRAYTLAGALVRDLVNRHGPEFPAALLASVAAGADFESAFESAAGESLDRAANSFWRRFTFWYRWFPFLTSSTALWLAVTVLALVAVRRRRDRTRLIEEKWRLEEAWEVESRRLEPVAPSDDELVN